MIRQDLGIVAVERRAWTACKSASETENYQWVMEPRLSRALACCFRWLTSILQSHTATFQHWSYAAAGLQANWPKNTWPHPKVSVLQKSCSWTPDPGTGVRFCLLGHIKSQHIVCNAKLLLCLITIEQNLLFNCSSKNLFFSRTQWVALHHSSPVFVKMAAIKLQQISANHLEDGCEKECTDAKRDEAADAPAEPVYAALQAHHSNRLL